MRQLAQLMIDQAPDAICVVDVEGRVQQCNQAFQDLFRFRTSLMPGDVCPMLFATEAEQLRVMQHVDTDGSFQGEVLNRRQDGEVFVSTLSASIILDDDGNHVGMMGISRDLSEQKELEARHSVVVENATDFIYTSNYKGEFTYANAAAVTMLGYTPEELKGQHFSMALHPEDREHVVAYYTQQFLSREVNTYLEFRVRNKAGETLWVGQNVHLKAAGEMVLGFEAIVRNITDRKRIEQELQESEQRYRELFETASDLIQSIDANGKLQYANRAWREALGYSEAELQELNVFELIAPESQEHCLAIFSEILSSGKSPESSITYQLLAKDGRKLTVQGSIAANVSDGKVTSVRTFLRDVSSERAAQEKLRASEGNFRLISGAVEDVFFLFDLDHDRYVYVSDNCGKVLGCSAETLVKGGYMMEHVHPKDAHALEVAYNSARKGYKTMIDYRLQLDGQTRWVREKLFPVDQSEGRSNELAGVFIDITQLKRQEEIIYEQTTEIQEGIRYAQRIQEASLSSSLQVSEILPESFVMYEPRDELSGDFYIVQTIATADGERVPMFVMADCTGHGIPGAILSALCKSLLQEAAVNRSVQTPAAMLDFARERLSEFFAHNSDGAIKDGMDVSVCWFNPKTRSLQFAGANQNCLIVRDGELLELAGDRQPVGHHEHAEPFSNQVFATQPGDVVYLASDGYYDQFGGERGRKYLRSNFKKLLVGLAGEPMDSQLEAVRYEFYQWKGAHAQIDDVCVMGVELW